MELHKLIEMRKCEIQLWKMYEESARQAKARLDKIDNQIMEVCKND